ncbi:MAG: isoleucine--tRNA ligase [Rhodospirillaceae bacterium]|nr:isoleucine--tRNA ligase [Rhodospirillaceae bacterium]|tara:strand:+ start:58347 stop:61169 length:2823 start_codon:yes stop_codon:yes gene_type:complete
MSVDYKSTVFLPTTDFPMRASLPEREPETLARWLKIDLYRRLREESKGREKFILHDGPPYANGNLHIGHALNKILKDVINRSQQMLGKDANYVPGWDCHGLPIEWKIEEKYRKEGKDKDEVPVVEFRQECREFADHWIGVQSEEFQRLGVIGDWKEPYTTMAYPAEASIVRELGKFLINGGLFRGEKPVMWSPVEKTALAEAEVEYHDHKSTQIWVRFPVVSASVDALSDGYAVIWTTTPWTIPGNRAIAFGAELDYAVVEISDAGENEVLKTGDKLLLAESLASHVTEACGVAGSEIVARIKGSDLQGTICRHPLDDKGYDFDVPLLPGDHVTAEDGTGLVHTAPGHGVEDFVVGQAHGIEVPRTVEANGCYYQHVPLFAGQHVYKADGVVAEALNDANALIHHDTLVHSYPHSWRSKAPLIYRTTPQWFISMDTNDLRTKALNAIEATEFYPASGRNRLHGMIENRPDWCVSRQRAWGVPITVFVNKETGEPLRDDAVMERIVQAVEQEGADCWFASDPSRFLGNDYNPEDYEQVFDILDVWFDSGSTHNFVLETRDDLEWPATLYLEGSDQHRGWFHSSLLESCGTRGRAPYDGVLTHGFVLAEAGVKMSKSKGNTVAPQEIIKNFGADILRIWVVASDYSEDLKIGPEIIKHQADAYRRLRNTFRYLLGNLHGFDEDERVDEASMPELERFVLHRMAELDTLVRDCCERYDFHAMFTALHNFCAVELSSFYFDIRKDTLYCDTLESADRRATRTVLDQLFMSLTTWLAPIIPFTTEEVWLNRFPEQAESDSVHLKQFPNIPASWKDHELAEKWENVRNLRRAVTGALEIERAEKRIGSSLGANAAIYASSEYQEAMTNINLADLCITSSAEFVDGDAPNGAFSLPDVKGVQVIITSATGEKCGRCWKILPEVGNHDVHKDLCGRCASAVGDTPVAA